MLKHLGNTDRTDDKILKELLKNCRQNYSQIAKKTSLSKEVVAYRIKRLEEKEIIRGYKTLINYEYIGLGVHELIVSLKKIDQTINKKIQDFLKKSDVLGYGDLMGHFDFNIIITAKGHEEVEEFMKKIKDVCSYNLESMDIMGLIEDEYVFADKLKKNRKMKIKEYERKILQLLINGARISLKKISKKLNKSYPSIVKSLKKLENANIIKAYYPDIDFRKIDLKEYLIYINTRHLTKEQEKRLRERLISHPNIFWYIKYLGKYDFRIEVISGGVADMRDIVDKIISEFKDLILKTKTVRNLSNKK